MSQQADSTSTTKDTRREAVRLLVTAIRNKEFHDKLEAIFQASKSIPEPMQRNNEVQSKLCEAFAYHGFGELSFNTLLRVSLDFCDRDTVGLDVWKDEKSYDPKLTLGEAWLKEARMISAQAGGVVG